MCLNTMISASGYSASQLVFGSNPVDPYGWRDQEEDQFAQQWKLRMMAQEAALKEVANRKLLRLLASNKTFNCTDVKIGRSVR